MRSEEDPTFVAEASVVPFPLEFKTKSGLKLSLELKGQDGDAFCLLGRKFLSGGKFGSEKSFQGKQSSYPVTASSGGKVNFPFTLEMVDRDGGECLLTVKEKLKKSSFLSRQVELLWISPGDSPWKSVKYENSNIYNTIFNSIYIVFIVYH